MTSDEIDTAAKILSQETFFDYRESRTFVAFTHNLVTAKAHARQAAMFGVRTMDDLIRLLPH